MVLMYMKQKERALTTRTTTTTGEQNASLGLLNILLLLLPGLFLMNGKEDHKAGLGKLPLFLNTYTAYQLASPFYKMVINSPHFNLQVLLANLLCGRCWLLAPSGRCARVVKNHGQSIVASSHSCH